MVSNLAILYQTVVGDHVAGLGDRRRTETDDQGEPNLVVRSARNPHAPPRVPQKLVDHACLNLRLRTSGGLYPWAFKKKGRELNVHVRGPLVFNTIDLILDAAVSGFGLAYLPIDQVREHITKGRLVTVLEDWTPQLSGYHLYYPNRKQPAAFALVVDALRYSG